MNKVGEAFDAVAVLIQLDIKKRPPADGCVENKSSKFILVISLIHY